MACTNIILARFTVIIKGDGFAKDGLPILNVIQVSGLGVGDQGIVTVTEQDKVVEIPDGVRALPTLGLVFRLNKSIYDEAVKKGLFEWWENRATRVCDIYVNITDRNFCPQHTYLYQGCSIKSLLEDDKSVATPAVLTLNLQVKPYDVIYKRLLNLSG